jgi:hypothetical protein
MMKTYVLGWPFTFAGETASSPLLNCQKGLVAINKFLKQSGANVRVL